MLRFWEWFSPFELCEGVDYLSKFLCDFVTWKIHNSSTPSHRSKGENRIWKRSKNRWCERAFIKRTNECKTQFNRFLSLVLFSIFSLFNDHYCASVFCTFLASSYLLLTACTHYRLVWYFELTCATLNQLPTTIPWCVMDISTWQSTNITLMLPTKTDQVNHRRIRTPLSNSTTIILWEVIINNLNPLLSTNTIK